MAAAAAEHLLQIGLGVDPRREHLFDLRGEGVDDGILDSGEPVLEEECAERRLDDRGEDVPVLREPLEFVGRRDRCPLDETRAEVELAGYLRAARPRDDVRARLGESSLSEVGMPLVERVGDGELQDAVAEELQPLVRVAALARPRCVGEDTLRQLRRERVDQLREVAVRGYWCEVT